MKPGDAGQFERGERIAGATLRHPVSETNKLKTNRFPFQYLNNNIYQYLSPKLRSLTLKGWLILSSG
jgi:hypothetical protein